MFSAASRSIFLALLLPTLASLHLGCTERLDARANTVILNDLPPNVSDVDLAGRWSAQSHAAHVSASMTITNGVEAGDYQVQLSYSHCLGTQIATRDARIEGGRLVLAAPFTWNDIATSLPVDWEAPAAERQGIDAFRVVTLDQDPLLIPEHYFEHASIRYFKGSGSWGSTFLAFIHRDQIQDPERLARLPVDSDFEIIDLNSVFYRL